MLIVVFILVPGPCAVGIRARVTRISVNSSVNTHAVPVCYRGGLVAVVLIIALIILFIIVIVALALAEIVIVSVAL